MIETKNGGSALPYPHERSIEQIHGMTLRDYFAAKAMQGYMATPSRQSYSYDTWAQAA